ncbi:MAG TPA: neutral/alkaline non-lysosomal ceramidase N-terminal domain-containing protein [Devosia sp.]|nr:neutral/alkaline non-lysosomal ceramidase N-terminal domain-containing protein [Devosia sp.]
MKAGVALVDITPDHPVLMAGFAARTERSAGVHDRLTVRAIAVDNTVLAIADVVGLDENLVARVRERSALPPQNIICAATHTHGAPISQTNRLNTEGDPKFFKALEDGLVEAIAQALANAVPARITIGMGDDPDVGRNRRHDDGPIDRSVPVMRFYRADGSIMAVLASYACHPVVLGADNRLLTADYPNYTRLEIEAAYPGAIAVFAQGCPGDINTGHKAHDSWTRNANNQRTFETAERLGRRVGKAALAAGETEIGDKAEGFATNVLLRLTRLDPEPLPVLADKWRTELAETTDVVMQIVLKRWIEWAETYSNVPPGNWTGRASVFNWGGVPITALPGEVFTDTGLIIRDACGNRPAFVLGYCDGSPGYIPSANEFQYGGYEVSEAYRFVGMAGAFAPGSAEALAGAVQALLGVAGLATSEPGPSA